MSTSNVPFKVTLQVAHETLKGLDTPRSLAVAMLADAYLDQSYEPERFDEGLKALGFRVNWYDQFSIDKFRYDYQATSLLTKLPSPIKDDVRLRTAALSTLMESEKESHLVNQRWSPATDYPPAFSELEQLGVPIEVIRRTLVELLGRAPSYSTLFDELEWSSGASVCLNRKRSSAETKAEFGTSVTYRLAKVLDRCGFKHPLVSDRSAWSLVPGNLVDTVPKNIVTDRTVAMSADINSLFQRAIGVRIQKRLLRWGINLKDQRLNQRACARAHITRDATVDLKNASNTVLLYPIVQSFPNDWVELLLDTREAYGAVLPRKKVNEHAYSRDDWFEYAMLSSMGNGFTFEVETALFFTLCLCSGAEAWEINVYGDDIIIPQRCVSLLARLLKVFGLSINIEKSFVDGTFFESCGIYCFHGVDVTPFKIKDLLYGSKDGIILCNKIRMAAHLSLFGNGCDKRYLPAWQVCLHWLPVSVRRDCRGPVGSGCLLYVNRSEMRNLQYSKKRGMLITKQLVPRLDCTEGYFEGVFPVRLWQSLKESTLEDSTDAYVFIDLERQLNGKNRGNTVKTQINGWTPSHLFIYGESWYDLGKWV